MPKFSRRSLTNLKQCHPDLQLIFREVIKEIDCSVVCGHRCEEDQTEAYLNGYSKLLFPQSKHNKVPSLAADVIPYPSGYKSIPAFKRLAKTVKRIAKEKKIKVGYGGDWKRFVDRPHWGLADKGGNHVKRR